MLRICQHAALNRVNILTLESLSKMWITRNPPRPPPHTYKHKHTHIAMPRRVDCLNRECVKIFPTVCIQKIHHNTLLSGILTHCLNLVEMLMFKVEKVAWSTYP